MKKLIKKIYLIPLLILLLLAGCKNNSEIKIGIMQIVEHESLDSARQGFIDELKNLGYEEGKNILSKINDRDFVVAMEISGNKMSSLELSKFIDSNISKNITFVIGGSYGLSSDVLKRANYKLSFSELTFPHQLFRVMLFEQIYRAFKIINNESYHK